MRRHYASSFKKAVGPAMKRGAVAHLQVTMGLSERLACTIVAADRTTIRYRSRRPPELKPIEKLRDPDRRRWRFGYRRAFVFASTVRLRAEIWHAQHSRRCDARVPGGGRRPLDLGAARARSLIAEWVTGQNEVRLQFPLGYRTPEAFAAGLTGSSLAASRSWPARPRASSNDEMPRFGEHQCINRARYAYWVSSTHMLRMTTTAVQSTRMPNEMPTN